MTRVPRPRRRGPALLAGLLVLVLLASVAVLVVTVPDVRAAQVDERRRAAVLAAARQQAVDFTTLDYRTLDRDLDRVLAGATGGFREEFARTVANVRSVVGANKAVSKGTVLAAGIVEVDRDSARVLVVADSAVTNARTPRPEQRHYRLQLDLVRVGTSWKTADLQFVG